MLSARVLGPLELDLDGTPVRVNRTRERALLSLLIAGSGQTLSADRLVDAVWGDSLPSKPLAALQTAVSRLRRAVGADVILTRTGGYTINLELVTVDAARFEELVASARGAVAEEAAAMLEEALGLWRGTPYAEFEFDDFARPEITRLQELRLTALEMRVQARLDLGHHEELVPDLQALVTTYPLDETLWAQLMVALYRSGRQADALAAYRTVRTILVEQLGLEPGPLLRRTEEQILTQDPALERDPGVRRTGVTTMTPQRLRAPIPITSMVGRDDDLRIVRELLASSRLVTITGPAGVGKTRLALQAVQDLADGYEDGAVFVAIDTFDDRWTVGDIARYTTEGLTDEETIQEQIVETLRGRSQLVVLDGCERLTMELAGFLAAVLSGCPEIRILASSRQRFGITGEAVLPLRPLRLPQPGEAGSPATDLFIQRASSLRPQEDFEAADPDLLARVVAAVDGLPLGIELAANRSAYLPLAELARQLEQRTDLLTSRDPTAHPKHGSLHAAIATSWEALDPEQRELFLAVSTFHAPWGIDDAAQMAGESATIAQVEGMVLDLVDRSLLMIGGSSGTVGAASFTMLRPIREFAAAALEGDARVDVFRQRHVHTLRSIAVRAGAALFGEASWDVVQELEERLPDIDKALTWLIENDPQAALRMAGDLGAFWAFSERQTEGERHLRSALDKVTEDSEWVALGQFILGSLIRPGGFALLEAVSFATFQDRWRDRQRFHEDDAARTTESIELLTEALATWDRLGMEPHSLARIELARSLATAGGLDAAEAALALANRERPTNDATCFAQQVWAMIGLARGQLDVAEERSRHPACEHAPTIRRHFRHATLARIAASRGDWEGAAGHFEDLLSAFAGSEVTPGAAIAHLHLSVVAAVRGYSEETRRHAGRALELGRRFGIPRLEPMVRIAQAWAHFVDRNYPLALEYSTLSLDLCLRTGDTYGIGFARTALGVVHNRLGDPETAVKCFREGLEVSTGGLGSAQTDTGALFHLANSYYLLGRETDAARLLGASARARERSRIAMAPGWRDEIEPSRALEKALGPAQFEALFQEGHSMGREAAFALALGG